MEHGYDLNRQWSQLKAPMLKKSWAPCLVLLLSQGAIAQTMPSAGSQMQQLPVVPGVPRMAPRVEVAPSGKPLATSETTPAGRFSATVAKNVWGQDILWVDYDQGISLHPVRSVDPRERRLERLASPSAEDNRISYGCINVPTSFWEKVVRPLFQNTMGVVYVLPDTKSLNAVFNLHPLTPVSP